MLLSLLSASVKVVNFTFFVRGTLGSQCAENVVTHFFIVAASNVWRHCSKQSHYSFNCAPFLRDHRPYADDMPTFSQQETPAPTDGGRNAARREINRWIGRFGCKHHSINSECWALLPLWDKDALLLWLAWGCEAEERKRHNYWSTVCPRQDSGMTGKVIMTASKNFQSSTGDNMSFNEAHFCHLSSSVILETAIYFSQRPFFVSPRCFSQLYFGFFPFLHLWLFITLTFRPSSCFCFLSIFSLLFLFHSGLLWHSQTGLYQTFFSFFTHLIYISS